MLNIQNLLLFRGKKTFICLAALILLTCNIYAEISTVISSIEKNGSQINKAQWNNFTASQYDSITFHFELKENSSINDDINYKIILTGSSTVPELDTYKRNYYTLKNLNEGDYLFKVQGFIKNKIEAAPAIIRFTIRNNEKSAANKNEINSIPKVDSLITKDVMIISILSIVVIGLVISLLFLKRRLSLTKSIGTSDRILLKEPGKHNKNINMQNNRGKNIHVDENEAEITEELFDYKYAYENLRKEYDKIKNENSFLKSNIENLNSNVKDLETANVQLAKQKERLLESKRQLEELQAQKEELFTIALHDIKNPAAAIKGFVELLESYDLNAHEQQEIMHGLADTSSKIIELAQQMSVALAKQAPEPALNPEKASIKEITDSVFKRNIAYAKKKGISIINNTSPNTPETLIDVFKIEEVIDNLINNAIKYSPSGTIVYVRSYFNESKITIEVEDNGVGLNEEDLKKAFGKGVILSSKPTGDETRSGLGLWISKKIIEDHGGKIWLKSKLGIGTKVGFDLPIKK